MVIMFLLQAMSFNMKTVSFSTGLLCIALIAVSCNNFTYTPRSKAKRMHERPSVELLSRIVEYRELRHNWPSSVADFTGLGQPFTDAFKGFPYGYTEFKIKDSNTMTFYFSDHIKDRQNYQQTGLTELNNFRGYVRFFKVKGKFTWRLKMG